MPMLRDDVVYVRFIVLTDRPSYGTKFLAAFPATFPDTHGGKLVTQPEYTIHRREVAD